MITAQQPAFYNDVDEEKGGGARHCTNRRFAQIINNVVAGHNSVMKYTAITHTHLN